jgi:hemoglobin
MNRIVKVLAGALVVAGAVALQAQAATQKKTLYDNLGGKAAIVAVVDDFVGNVAADKRINAFFAADVKDPARLAKFKGNLVDQICQAAGGPCKYMGKDMKTAHAGMGISTADFNALVEDLVKSLNKFKVAKADQDTLLGVLSGMRTQIVEKK